jgi:hypothetical protein
MTVTCPRCGDDVPTARAALGRKLCLPCGEEAARQERTAWTVVPMHKSNYVLLTDRRDLPGIGNKGGLHR